MDRKLVYPSQQPSASDFLATERNAMVALAYQTQAWAGVSAVVDGLTVIPAVPASLSVQVTAGSIYALNAIDATAYSTLPLDAVHQVMKQGILLDTISLTLTPPVTSGQAINYLIQVQFQEVDTDNTVLPYFNSANPTIPFSGPNNAGTAQPTTRKGTVAVQAKAGTAATAGTQTTPSPDAGWTGLYAVTVAYGATALTTGQIAVLTSAPYINVKLPNVPTYVQAGTFAFAPDTGTANAMVATLSPVPSSYSKMSIFVKKIASPNTGAMTINVNGLGAVSIVNADGTAMTSGQMTAGFLAHLVFDGTSMRFMNGTTTTAVGALTASSGEGINVNGSAVVALNYPSLSAPTAALANTDLFSFYSQGDVHHRILTWASLITAISGTLPRSINKVSVFTASGTWTKTAGSKNILAFGIAGGGAGGSDRLLRSSGGGAAGGGFVVVSDVSAVSTLAVTIGAGGTYVSQSRGNTGGDTVLGTLATAKGGTGGFRSASGDLPQAGKTSGAGGWGVQGSLGSGVVGLVWPGAPGTFGEVVGGHGGSTLFGGGGYGGDTYNGLNAATGGDGIYGSGGGGGCGAGGGNGGQGGAGVILIIEFA